jgi:predicted nuclease of predicted toxin-antitoxin system
MAKIRFYTDEHVSKAVIRGLHQRGVDVLSVPAADMMGATDEAHLAFALSQSRVIFTQDADFLRLASQGQPHAGIVYTSQTTPVGKVIFGLMLIYQLLDTEDMENQIEFI